MVDHLVHLLFDQRRHPAAEGFDINGFHPEHDRFRTHPDRPAENQHVRNAELMNTAPHRMRHFKSCIVEAADHAGFQPLPDCIHDDQAIRRGDQRDQVGTENVTVHYRHGFRKAILFPHPFNDPDAESIIRHQDVADSKDRYFHGQFVSGKRCKYRKPVSSGHNADSVRHRIPVHRRIQCSDSKCIRHASNRWAADAEGAAFRATNAFAS